MPDRAHDVFQRLPYVLASFLALALLGIGLALRPACASTQPASAPHLSTAQTQQLLDMLKDDTKRQQFIATLSNLTTAQKAAQSSSAEPHSLLDQALTHMSALGTYIMRQGHVLTQTVMSLRSVGPWVGHIWHSPDLQLEITRICLRVVVLVAGGLALRYILRLLFRKPRHALEDRARAHDRQSILHETAKITEADQPHAFSENADLSQEDQLERLKHQGALAQLIVVLRRVPYTLGYLGLDVIGILMFPLVALLIQTIDPSPDARTMQAIWSITWLANVALGVWLALLHIFLAPKQPWLRLTTLRDQTATFLYCWLSRIGIVTSWGITALIILYDCAMPANVILALAKLLALAVHIMVAFMILNSRNGVTQICERIGKQSQHLAGILRLFAKSWWIIALFFDVALWLVWAADIRGGYQLILHLFVRTCIALLAVRLVSILIYGGIERIFHTIDGWDLEGATEARILRYAPAARRVANVVVGLLTIFSLAIAWGTPLYAIIGQHTFGAALVSSLWTIVIALLIGVGIWEAANITFERHIQKLTKQASAENATRMARLRTLQPMFRILLLIILAAIVGLTILSQLGVNTGPLLAGASIFGVAIGFGSQKLVQDFISGIFLLMENALTVGDAVTLNGTYGIIEKLSLRTVHVRANDGSMNIFPFSSLGQIINYNRDFARAIILAEVSYDSDTDEAVKALHDITAEMRADPAFKDLIIDDLNVWGVDSLNDSSVTIKGTLPTTTAGRWPVQRQFNRRMKKCFQARGIGIPFPTRTLDIPGFETFLNKDRMEEKTKNTLGNTPDGETP